MITTRRGKTLNQRLRNIERDICWWWDRNKSGFFVGVTSASMILGMIATFR
jgi:hypothetical protein